MNGAVYISFFQGQLESVLEQVVQLAVQEISKTVGSSLNTLLLETAVKEQENRRLRHQLQSRESRAKAGDSPADGGGSPAKNKSERPDGESPERQQQQHAPGGQGTQAGVPIDTRRREQRRRAVEQLKSVMTQVLDFAVRELTKIVEASFDDLLLEITKMDTEQRGLEERLGRSSERGGRAGGGVGAGGRRRGSENDSMSPSDSEDAREELAEGGVSKETEDREDPERPPTLSPAQDWVPILDKVFGQKWCNEIQELEGGDGGLGEGRGQQAEPLSAPPLTLEPSPSSPQQDPRWTPLEDMEVFSPDEETLESQRRAEGGVSSESGRRSSASMLHRLLTLPSQLLEDDNEAAAAAATATTKETLAALGSDGNIGGRSDAGRIVLPPLKTREEEEEEEEEGEDKGKKKKRRRVWSECEECGRRFSRMSLLKAHRQTHVAENAAAAADTPSPSSPPSSNTLALRCSQCGKRFSSATRLHSHVRTQHLEDGVRQLS